MGHYQPVIEAARKHFPVGRLQSPEEVEGKTSLFRVGQMGYIEEWSFEEGAKIVQEDGTFVAYGHYRYPRSTFAFGREWNTRALFLVDCGIYGQTNESVLVNTMEEAEAYAKALLDDPEYRAAVKTWHDYCNELFRDIEEFADYD